MQNYLTRFQVKNPIRTQNLSKERSMNPFFKVLNNAIVKSVWFETEPLRCRLLCYNHQSLVIHGSVLRTQNLLDVRDLSNIPEQIVMMSQWWKHVWSSEHVSLTVPYANKSRALRSAV